ncbi:putative intracellular protease/amidase [Litoreibacter ponti]|uniref:Putative intracellular protease/amidase n=1 Tax=Litoreibacter ponti TaxID=1510457 RepID=A0A2T6BLD7_9RHOB|nr:type 1 glutamine amidotransferase domain-containing protein [Litoreibacter ponti]PTX56865.1 putative intracellular protease/amidase [Litoreibacter ponti]
MSTPKILMVATSAREMNNGEATGVWLEELTTPYYAFKDAGADVTLTSILGMEIPVDERSLSEDDKAPSVERYLEDEDLQQMVKNTPSFNSIDTDGFDAIFLPGGHGTMFDYPDNAELAALILKFDADGKVVSAVCHGPAGLVSATKADGRPLVEGRRVAGFTNSEEHAVGLADAMPFLLESKLKDLGANHEAGPDFESFAVRDGNLITGQNPASATETATMVLDALAAMEKAA